MAYLPSRGTYVCDLCGYESGPYDKEASRFPCDEEHGEMWECADCGKVICSACFEKTANSLERMKDDIFMYFNVKPKNFLFLDRVLCPACYIKHLDKVNDAIFNRLMKLCDVGKLPVAPREGGPRSLYCSVCNCWVPNTANAEMRKEGWFASSHICGTRDNAEIFSGELHRYEKKRMQFVTIPNSACSCCKYRKEEYPGSKTPEECMNCGYKAERHMPYFTKIPIF